MPIEVNTSDLPDFNSALPRLLATVTVLEVSQSPSKAGEPMDTFKIQVLAPDTIEHAGQKCQVAGRVARTYSSYSPNAISSSLASLKKLGLEKPAKLSIPSSEEVASGAFTTIPQIQTRTKELVGARFACYVKTEPTYETDNGRWDGKRVKDEVTGDDKVNGHRLVIDLSGVQSKAENQRGEPVF